MDNYESCSIVLWTILGSNLRDINRLTPSLYYGIRLPEEEEDYNLSFILNLKINELKQILESCGIIPI